MTNPGVRQFFVELYYRLRTKSPRFFFILQLVGASLTFLGYLPSMLQQWFGVEVPGHFITMCEDISKYAAGFFAATMLPAKTEIVAQTESGEAVTMVNEKKFPYTSKVDEKKVDETVPPPPIVQSETIELPHRD